MALLGQLACENTKTTITCLLRDCRRLCSERFISLCTWSVLTHCR